VPAASTVIKCVHPCRVYVRVSCDSHKKHEILPGRALQEMKGGANVNCMRRIRYFIQLK